MMMFHRHFARMSLNKISRNKCASLCLSRPLRSKAAPFSRMHLTHSHFYSNRTFHISVSVCKTRLNETTDDIDDQQYDQSKAWIPPSRPINESSRRSQSHIETTKPSRSLTEDSAQSHIYLETENEIEDETRTFLMNEMKSGKSGKQSVRFVDLSDMDEETMKDAAAAYNNESQNSRGICEEITDDDYDDIILFDEDEDDDENVVLKEENYWAQDPIIQEIMNDPDFDADDEEMIELQGQLISERLRDIKRIEKRNHLSNSPTSEAVSKTTPIEEVGSSELDNFLKEQNFQDNRSAFSSDRNSASIEDNSNVDWLKTRRSKLYQPNAMLKPSEAELARKNDAEIPIIKNTLLSSDEIISCLNRLGAQDTVLVQPDEEARPFLGWEGLIIATGSSHSHIRTLVDAIAMNLRRRDLADNGVAGAKYGPEGGNTGMSAKKRRKMGQTKRGKRAGDGWMVVDCRNYLVHVQDDVTRRSIDLEGLWSAGKRGQPGRDLRKLNIGDENEVDDYVDANPIPDEYADSLIASGENFWSDGSGRGGYGKKSLKKSGRWIPVGQKKRNINKRTSRNRL